MIMQMKFNLIAANQLLTIIKEHSMNSSKLAKK